MSEPGRPVVAWMAVLEQIEQSLGQSLARIPQETPAPAPVAGIEAGPMERLDQRLGQWQRCLERVEREAEAAEADLASEEAAVREWLESAVRLRETLAACLSREV